MFVIVRSLYVALVTSEKPCRLGLYIAANGNPFEPDEHFLALLGQKKIEEEPGSVRVGGFGRDHERIDFYHGGFEKILVDRCSLRRHPLKRMGVGNHQRIFSRRRHSDSFSCSSHHDRFLSR